MMSAIPSIAAAEARQLRACLRDLVAFSAMPASWVGRSPGEIAESLPELLSRMFDLEAVQVALRDVEGDWRLDASDGQVRGGRAPRAKRRREGRRVSDLTGGSRLATYRVGLDGELGGITVGTRRTGFPGELDSLLLQVVANQTAVALHHAVLLRQRERAERESRVRAEQQAVASRLGMRALNGLPLEQLYHETVAAVRDALHADFVDILELLPDGQGLVLKAAVDGRPGLESTSMIGTGPATQVGYSVQAREPVIVEDFHAETRFAQPPLLVQRGVRSGVTVVLRDLAGPCGVLGAYAREPRAFTREGADFLQLIGNLLGAASQHCRAEAERQEALAQTASARAEAERASRNKSEFLAMISHELRTPLNAIAGYVQILEMGVHGPTTHAQQEDLGRIRYSYDHLLGLINNVLTYLKLGSGHLKFDIVSASLDEVLETVETLIRPQLDAKQLRFEERGAGTDLQVRADPEKLRQIVLNLLSNAAKFTDPGGSVRLLCTAEKGTVSLRVEDTGCGIPAEKLDSVFEPYVQVENQVRHAGEGTGLGLAISRGFARAMGGDLRVESEVGKGSAFTVTLPRGA